MKIAYIYPEILPSRKARAISVVNTFRELSKISDCTLFVDQNSNIDNIVKNYNIDSAALNFKKIKKNLLKINSNKIFNRNLLKELQKGTFDIVYVRHLKVAKFLIQRGFRVIFEAHEIFYQTFQEESGDSQVKKIKKIRLLEQYIYQECLGIIFINKTLQIKFNSTFRSICQKQTVVHNGMNFDDGYIKKDFNTISSMHYVGNFFKWKGLQDAISAVKHIDGFCLEIIGGDAKDRVIELKKQASNLNINNRVNFLGYKDSQKVKTILQQKAKVAIIPNILSIRNQFSMPIKLYEYMATSNIVIAANMPTIKEVVTDKVNGFLFESGNVESLVETINMVISLPNSKLQNIAKNAYETSKKFTWKSRAKKILNFCVELDDET
jgi:glycosyltransferase involved in cell wall biosynthesis